MPSLNRQQIQFIYNYLEHSGIEYLDARVEMADHVASALEAMEGDFNENFRQYMLENKDSLLKQYSTFKKSALKKGLTVLKDNVMSVWFIVAVVFLVVLHYPAARFYDDETITEAYLTVSLVPSFILGGYLVYSKVFSKWTFSILDQIFGAFLIAGLIIDPVHFLESPLSLAIYYSIGIVFNIATAISFHKIYQRYNRLYVQNLTVA